MACKKWESEGLLYTAGELSKEATAAYESHLSECEDCSVELQAYKEMFGEFSTKELLLETPSAECDTKILKAMEAALQEEEPKETVAIMPGFFTMLLQRVAIPLAIFAFAVTVGIRISSSPAVESDAIVAKKDVPAVVEDSVDSSSDSGRIFIEGGGEGVIPVTLEEK